MQVSYAKKNSIRTSGIARIHPNGRGRPGGSPVVEKEPQSHKGAEVFSVYLLYSVVKIPVEYPRLQIPNTLLRLQRAQSFSANSQMKVVMVAVVNLSSVMSRSLWFFWNRVGITNFYDYLV